MITLVWRVVRDSPVALTTREVCVLLNGVSPEYCQNVDGRGGHCRWAYHRGDGFDNGYHLAVPPCRYRYVDVAKTLKTLAERGDVKRATVVLRDRQSRWGFDRFVINYVREGQLYAKLRRNPLNF